MSKEVGVHLLYVVSAFVDAANRDKKRVANNVIGFADEHGVRTCSNTSPFGVFSESHVLILWNENVWIRAERSGVQVEGKMCFVTLSIRVGVVSHSKIEKRERLVFNREVAD